MTTTSVCSTTGVALDENVWASQRTTTEVALDENFSLPTKLFSVQRLAPLLTSVQRLRVHQSAQQVNGAALDESVKWVSLASTTTGAALDENVSLPSKWVSVQRLAPLVTRTSICPASGSV